MEQMEHLEINGDGGGNSEIPPVKPDETEEEATNKRRQHLYWCFTLNNYSMEQLERLETIFRHETKWYVFQEETGESGTPHLQGTIYLKERQRLSQIRKLDLKIHWKPTISVSGSLVYCTKLESRTGKIYSNGIDLPEPLDLEEPYGWQLEILKIIKDKPNKRTINWFWESTGGVGKTTLCKYLVEKHNALMLCGKSNDMYHMLSKFPNKRKIIIIDVPRSTQDYINYGAIEQIKNGLIFSGKYEGCQLNFNSPHVIVFANVPPEYEKMSEDRWNVINIKHLAKLDATHVRPSPD